MRAASSIDARLSILMALLFSVQCGLLMRYVPTVTRGDANHRIEEIKAWLPNSEFAGVYKMTSEETLAKTIMFVEDPVHHFKLIRDMDMTQFWENISLHDAFMREKKKSKSMFYFHDRLKDMIHWQAVEDEFGSIVSPEDVVSILTFLLLNCQSGDYEDILRDLYMREFGSYPSWCIRDLKKRKDWKRVVDQFGEERVMTITKVVKRLRNSGFEKEFKEYLVTRYPILRESVQKKK